MENLGIDGKLMLAQVINFAIFFFIFRKFMATPFRKFLEAEKFKEKEKEKLLQDAQKMEANLTTREAEMKKRVKVEFDAALKKAHLAAESKKDEIINQAKMDADQIVAKAKKQIETERASLDQEVKRKVADLSIFMVEKALRDSLDDSTKRKVTQQILKNLPRI